MAFSRYNAKDTSIIVDGVHITQLGENMWNFEKVEALAENVVGAQGDIVRSEINDPIYKAEITVQATSPQYNFLYNLKDRTEPFPLWMINKTLGRTEGGTQAMITEVPPDSLGKTAEDATFGFEVYDGQIIAD